VLKLDSTKSFAIRSYRAGRHDFTSQAVAENAGAAVKRVTNAKVNLTKPDHEIEIEVRSRKTYVFTERIPGPGGLPVGTGGDVLAVIKNKEDALAAWLIAKRGMRLTVLTDKKALKYAEALKKWHYGKKMDIMEKGRPSEIAKKHEIRAVVTGEKVTATLGKDIARAKMLHLRPIAAMGKKETAELALKTGI
jgi:thiamine biosynthesis protein ThiI